MRILIAIHSVALGGAERMVADLSRCWAEEGHDVTVFTKADRSSDAYRLHPHVKRIALGWNRPTAGVGDLLKMVGVLRAQIHTLEPDVVIGMCSGYCTLAALASLGQPCRVVGCEYAVPSKQPVGLVRVWLRCITYRFLDVVTTETQDAADWLLRNTWLRRAATIPKSVMWPLSSEEPQVPPEIACKPGRKIVLAAGRLVPEKGYDALLLAFSRVAHEYSDWDLVIVGEGPCRAALEAQAVEPTLRGRVFLPGRVGNMAAWYSRAAIFAVSSRHEGGPNVLVEALAHGVPAVSFDCDVGPRAIIRDGVEGILVPPDDTAAFAATLARLMDNEALRVQMAERAVEARQRFSEANHMRNWDALFRELGLDTARVG